MIVFSTLFFTHAKEKQLDCSTVGISSGSPTVAPFTAKQCIFYPVKEEEEGELLVEPRVNSHGMSDTEVSEERREPCKKNKKKSSISKVVVHPILHPLFFLPICRGWTWIRRV